MNAPQPHRSASQPPDGEADPTGESATVIPTNGPVAIRTPDQRVRVFVSSTLDELATERAAVRQAIMQLRLTPVMFELGARPHPPRDLYRAYLAQSDVFVGIYWQRYGWVAPGSDISGLEDEEQLSAGKPRLIYLKQPAPQREPRLQELLNRLREEAVASYQKFSTPDELREVLADDLALLLTERFTRVDQLSPPATPAPLTALAGEQFTKHALPPLPLPRDRLVDRVDEVSTTCNLLLRADSGLVTLTGPGGVGKTRVALQVAADCGERFADGIAYLSLASLTDPRLVAMAIAQGLGVAGDERRPVEERLLEMLRPQQLLLVLDNLEQLVTAAAEWIAKALEAAPRLKILVTSREPLRVREERIVPIPPLALPDQRLDGQATSTDVASLAEVASVALFVERARGMQPDFTLTSENAAAIAAICRRLDGLPLAIELAAARLPVLPPDALQARLERRLPLLTRGPRDLPARQQTLRATIAWSYDLLDEQAQALFRQLAVFVGGFTLAAAQAVCRVCDDPELADVGGLEGIAFLIDKNLLQTRDGSDAAPRFGMLETIREFALEQLRASTEEATAAQQRHADFFLAMAEEVQPHLYDTDRDVWFSRMESDDDNLHAALAWTTSGMAEERTLEAALRFAGVFAWYWYTRGQLQEGRSWLERLLAQARESEQAAQGQSPTRQAALGLAHHGLGWLALAQGDVETAAVQAGQDVAIFRALGATYRQWLANALLVLGMVQISQGTPAAARPLLEEGLSLSRELRGSMGHIYRAYVLFQLGRAAQAEGDPTSARDFYEQSLTLFRESGDTLAIALIANASAVVAGAHGDETAARMMLPENMPPARRRFNRYEVAQLLLDSGSASLRQGNASQAQSLLVESLRLWSDIGAPAGIARALAGLAGVATTQEQAERAGRLYGAAQVLLPLSGRLTADASGPDIDQSIAAAHAHLDVAEFDAGLAAGQTMTTEQATTYAEETT